MAEEKRENTGINQEILIKPFSKENLEDIYRIIEENFPRPWIREQILLENIFSYKVVLEVNNKVAGFLFGEIIYEQANILLVAISKEFQGKGYGTYLVNHFLDICKEKDVKRVFLEVSDKNKKAINLYKKAGFKKIDLRQKYYSDGSNAFVMMKEIF